MKFKGSTVMLLVAALALGGVAVYVQSQGTPEEQQQASQKLFPFEEGQVQSFLLKTPGRSLRFQKNDQGEWEMLEPDKSPADPAAVAYLLNLLGAGNSESTFTAPPADAATYGLQTPLATIEVKLVNQQTHRLVLGTYNFNRSSLYAQVDPPATPGETITVSLVPLDFENAVNRPTEGWKGAIASPTPTATPSPTATPANPGASPTASPGASPTPSPTVSPTASPGASPTVSPTASPTVSPAASPTPTPTVSPAVTPSPTVTPAASPSPTASPTP